MTDTTLAPTDDLQKRCAEIIGWHRTGVLVGDALRSHAESKWPGAIRNLQMAERATENEALCFIAKWGAPAPAPTDAEIEELLQSCGMRWAERSFWQLEDADLHPAIRAVLAKWGAPATASGEVVTPFGYFRADPFGWTDCAESDEGAKPLYEKPPAQEAREK